MEHALYLLDKSHYTRTRTHSRAKSQADVCKTYCFYGNNVRKKAPQPYVGGALPVLFLGVFAKLQNRLFI
jgi:hypothetical protein